MEKTILKIALGVIIAMIIFPPYEMGGTFGNTVIENGYAFILMLPECYKNSDNCGFSTRVDILRLFLQVLIVGSFR